MLISITAGLIALSAANIFSLPPKRIPVDSLKSRIERRVAEAPGAIIGVAFHDLQTGDSLYLNADDSFHAASTMKVPVMIELVRASNANETAHMLGAHNIRVLRGVEDNKAFRAGMNNTTTARDLAVLLEAIETGRAASRSSCDEMRDILLHQEFNEEIPAGLPAGTRVAHKTGWITGVLHDAAVVYPPGRKPYILVVLTRDIPDVKVARRLISDISRMVWEHAVADRMAVSP
jgi:beta-lactamase class A